MIDVMGSWRAWGSRATRVALVAAGLAGGCEPLECGPGTIRDGNECVALLAPTCGPGTCPTDGSCRPCPPVACQTSCGKGTHLEGCTCVPNFQPSGNAGRVKQLAFTEPASLGAGANDTLQGEFSTGSSLMFVGAYGPMDGFLRIFTGTGLSNADDTFTLDGATSSDVQATETDGGFVTEPFDFRIFALSATPLLLEDAVLSDGVLATVDGLRIVMSARFEGVLTYEAAQAIFVDLANATLAELIIGFGAPLDVDTDGVDGPDAWRIAGAFETEPVWLVE